MSAYAWLADIHIGDKVVVCTTYNKKLREVTRVTRTQIIVESGNVQLRFRRKDGWEPGAGYHRAWLRPYTPEVEESIALEHIRDHTYSMLSQITHGMVFALTRAQCQQVLDVLSQVGMFAQKDDPQHDDVR